jgi:hypothetical protein
MFFSFHRMATLWTTTAPEKRAELAADGVAFRGAYLRDAQGVFSRVQHHMHRKTKKGYEPLKACRPKTKKAQGSCKADFPKTRLCVPKAVVVCRGLAKRLGLRVSGRRNAFGCVVGARRCPWQSGTTPSFAVLFRSNSHTFPNLRVPLLPATHDAAACQSAACAAHVAETAETKAISKLAQRAQREVTGYHCGYTFKSQPVGKRFVKAAAEGLNQVAASLEDKSAGQKWHRITHQVLTDFQHRCIKRPATEEWNLAAHWHEHDVTNAEFLRTYRSADFPGG